MARKIEIEVTGDTRHLEKAMGRASKTTESSFSKIGTAAKLAGAAIATGLAVGAVKAVQAASNLEEQINKTTVVFEKSAPAVQKWSKSLSRSFGLSQRAALEAAGTYGNMLKPMGLAPALAAKMSMKMTELAGDLASFNNASPEETLDALRAGLSGETEPLRRFGVFLNEARVKAEALRLGLVKAGEELTPAAKAQATYSLILKDSSDAQGDFARTSKSLPNLLRSVRATVENLAAKIGTRLLPIVAAAVGKFEELLGWLDKVAGAGDLTMKVRLIFEGLKAMGGNLLDMLKKTLLGSAGKLKPIKLPGGKIIEFERVGASAGLVKSLQDMFEQIDWPRIGKRIGQNISDAMEVSSEWLNRAFDTARAWVDSHGDQLADLGATMILRIVNKLIDPAFWAKNWELVLGIALATFPIGRVGVIGGKFALFFLRPLEKLIPSGLGRIIALGVDTVAHQFRRLPPLVQEVFRQAARGIVVALSSAWNWIRTQFGKLPAIFRAALRIGVFVAFASAVVRVFNTIVSAVRTVIDWVHRLIDAIRSIPTIRDVIPDRGGGVPFVPGIATGGHIARSGLAVVHKGEQVVPARVVNRGGGSTSSRGRYVVMGDREFVDWLRSVDGNERRRNGGRGIL